MRIKRFAALAAVAVMALGLAACGDDDSESPAAVDTAASFAAGTTMAKLKTAGKIRIGTKFDQPGFGLKGLDGLPAGFDVEMGKIIAAKLGIAPDKIEWKETPSTVREQVLEQDTVDLVIATYTINDTRKQRVDFAGPYYVAGQHILVKADDTSITGPDSFKAGDKKVCSVSNSTPANNIKKYLANEAQQLVLFDIYQKCIDALSGGQVNAVTTDNVILTGFIARNEGKFKLAGQKFTDEPYGIGLKKGDTAFRTWINDVLEAAAKDGSYAKAWKDTAGKFDAAVPTAPPVNRY